jgi:selenium-binding protein 1
MKRREFLAASAAALCPSPSNPYECLAKEQVDDPRTFATPSKARESPPEKLAYAAVHYAGTGIQKPDYLATIDVDPTSRTY